MKRKTKERITEITETQLQDIYAMEMTDNLGYKVIVIRDAFKSNMFIVIEEYENLPYTISANYYSLVRHFENDLNCVAEKLYYTRKEAVEIAKKLKEVLK